MALNSIKRKELNLCHRDKAAMLSLYHSGIIAAGHLVRLFWSGQSYGYLRLRMLAESDYIDTMSFQENLPGYTKKKRKISSMYFITTKGIEAIHDLLEEKPRPSWKNRPDKDKFFEYYHMGELWCRFYENNLINQQQWLPSRQSKKVLEIANHAPLHSIATIKNSFTQKEQYYAFYYLPAEASSRRVAMVKNFLPEADIAGIEKHFVVCADGKTTQKALNIFTKKFPDPHVYVLQWDNAAETLPKYLTNEQVFYQELADRLKQKYDRVNLIPSGLLESGPYKFKNKNAIIYAAELISGHLATFARLQHLGSAKQPEQLFAFLPSVGYYHLIRHLLPQDLTWLYLVIRDRNTGKDIYRASR